MDGSSQPRPDRRRKSINQRSAKTVDRVDFQKVFAHGRRVRGGEVNIIYLQRQDQEKTHWGIAIGRKYGTAVKRNRVRRVAREILRANANIYPNGYDLVLEILTKGNVLAVRQLRDKIAQVVLKAQTLLKNS